MTRWMSSVGISFTSTILSLGAASFSSTIGFVGYDLSFPKCQRKGIKRGFDPGRQSWLSRP